MKNTTNKKIKSIAVLAIASVILLSSCKKENTEPEKISIQSYMVFGEYYGNCAWIIEGKNPCVNMFKWNGDSLIEDMNPIYPSHKEIYKGFSTFTRISCKYYCTPIVDSIEQKLIKQFPMDLLNEKDTVIGQPDATDGGGWYVEIKDELGNQRFYLIDKSKNNIPAYLYPFVDELDKTINSLKNCNMWCGC